MNSENSHSINPLENLSRGRACYTCRLRKTKCDGVRPVCTQCIQRGREMDCEYTDNQGRTRIQVLEEQVRLLQNRLHELQSPGTSSRPVLLHNPYESINKGKISHLQGRRTESELDSESRISESSLLRIKPSEVSHEAHRSLLRTIIAIISEKNFSFGSSWFRDALILPLKDIVCTNTIPIPALLNAIYLWAARFSRGLELENVEEFYYQLTEETLLEALASENALNVETKLQQKTQVIQAHALFAQYLFLQGRIFEGRYHTNAAVTLAISCGLHQMQPSSQLHSNIHVDTRATSESANHGLTEPVDIKDHGELVHTFWIVFILDRFWSAASGLPCAHADRQVNNTLITTPWHLASKNYDRTTPSLSSFYEGNSNNAGTVQSFLSGVLREHEYEDISVMTLHARAAALYEKSYSLVLSLDSAPVKEQETILSELRALTYTTQDFLRSIDPLSQLLLQQPIMPLCERNTLLLVHALAEGAMIRVYSVGRLSPGFEDTKRMLAHAQQVFRIIDIISHGESRIIDPMFSFLGLSASQVFFNASSALNVSGASSSEQTQHSILRSNAKNIAEALERCARDKEHAGSIIFEQHADKIFNLLNLEA